MTQGGFFERKSISPTGITLVIALHAAALSALAMSKMDVPVMKVFTPIKIKNVPIPPDPAPIQKVEKAVVQPRSRIDSPKPLIAPPPKASDVVIPYTPDIPIFTTGATGTGLAADPPKPKPAILPMRVDAAMLPSSVLQPPYPAALERAGEEGSVTIRVAIDAKGRVVGTEKVSATNDSFYRATERHARTGWRFRPATLDGKPVASSRVVTVRFTLDG